MVTDKWDHDTLEWIFFSEYYKLCESMYDVKPDAEYYEKLSKEIQKTYDAFREVSPKMESFVRHLLIGFSEYVCEEGRRVSKK